MTAGRHRHGDTATRPAGRGWSAARSAAVLAVAVGVAGVLVAVLHRSDPGPSPAGPGVAAQVTAQPALPKAVRIPRIGVSSDLVPLAVDAAGVLQPPPSADVAGWHADGTVPGQIGPAVIAGHVDSRYGPGVFFSLAELETGDDIEVVRSDGQVLTFEVLSTETVGKDEFPTERVYGPTPLPELHLITCGGSFDRHARHYLDNVIVRAARV